MTRHLIYEYADEGKYEDPDNKVPTEYLVDLGIATPSEHEGVFLPAYIRPEGKHYRTMSS